MSEELERAVAPLLAATDEDIAATDEAIRQSAETSEFCLWLIPAAAPDAVTGESEVQGG